MRIVAHLRLKRAGERRKRERAEQRRKQSGGTK
jgi:hypothetical protein